MLICPFVEPGRATQEFPHPLVDAVDLSIGSTQAIPLNPMVPILMSCCSTFDIRTENKGLRRLS